jgi:hypothetical protein
LIFALSRWKVKGKKNYEGERTASTVNDATKGKMSARFEKKNQVKRDTWKR